MNEDPSQAERDQAKCNDTTRAPHESRDEKQQKDTTKQ